MKSMMKYEVVTTNGLGDGKGYEDILHHPRPVSPNHPPMSPGERAAQFSPFAALSGYEGVIRQTQRQNEERVEGEIRHEITQDKFPG